MRGRILTVLGLALTIALVGIGIPLVALGLLSDEWPPRSSSGFGVGCGVLAGVIVLFEMLIWPRKWFRGRRLGRARIWMLWHIGLGFVSLPVVVLHSGFGFAGPLPATTLALFIAVYVSGIWGLVLQQWLPQKLLTELPGETIAAELERSAEQLVGEAGHIVDSIISGGGGLGSFPDSLIHDLSALHNDALKPYLLGVRSTKTKVSRNELDRRFTRLRNRVPMTARVELDRLSQLVEIRRQMDRQSRMHFWLHSWLIIHLPLSVAMTGVMVLHAIRALKYW